VTGVAHLNSSAWSETGLSAQLTSGGKAVAGQTVTFSTADGTVLCHAQTDAQGWASCSASPLTLPRRDLGLLLEGFTASFAGTDQYKPSQTHGLTVLWASRGGGNSQGGTKGGTQGSQGSQGSQGGTSQGGTQGSSGGSQGGSTPGTPGTPGDHDDHGEHADQGDHGWFENADFHIPGWGHHPQAIHYAGQHDAGREAQHSKQHHASHQHKSGGKHC
jgi:hypothetical protein